MMHDASHSSIGYTHTHTPLGPVSISPAEIQRDLLECDWTLYHGRSGWSFDRELDAPARTPLLHAHTHLTSPHLQVLGHHIYTNILGTDPDLPAKIDGDLRYLVPRQVYKTLYQYQWIYMPILYGLLGIKFRMQDIVWTFGSEMNGTEQNTHTHTHTQDHTQFPFDLLIL